MLSADGELTNTTIYSFPRSCTGFPARIVPDRHFTADVQISFVLFYEIEKASNTLWNLLLGILDKGTLTLSDNRKVDFSRAMIFMTRQSRCSGNRRSKQCCETRPQQDVETRLLVVNTMCESAL